ncbi:hypothetical protein BC832DRAFT_593056 [Gaertneriomyces semiglobifer]|nr:hypothetical protein BC832DRAFT_593056 [Gaertneriomyces semiglobifer]
MNALVPPKSSTKELVDHARNEENASEKSSDQVPSDRDMSSSVGPERSNSWDPRLESLPFFALYQVYVKEAYLMQLGVVECSTRPKPLNRFKITSSLFCLLEEHGQLRGTVVSLKQMVADGRLCLLQSPWNPLNLVFKDADGYYIDSLTFSSVLIALGTFRSLTAGINEDHVKIDLWAPFFSTVSKLSGFPSNWEYVHLFPGHAGPGSSRSDMAAVVLLCDGTSIPFLIVEFEIGGLSIRKDHLKGSVGGSSGAADFVDKASPDITTHDGIFCCACQRLQSQLSKT